MPSSKGSSQPRDRAQVSRTAGGFFTVRATREDETFQRSSIATSSTLWPHTGCPSLLPDPSAHLAKVSRLSVRPGSRWGPEPISDQSHLLSFGGSEVWEWDGHLCPLTPPNAPLPWHGHFPRVRKTWNLTPENMPPGFCPGRGADMDESRTGEGNGNPLQYSCLGNPMDRGASQATVHGGKDSDTTARPTHSSTRTRVLTRVSLTGWLWAGVCLSLGPPSLLAWKV